MKSLRIFSALFLLGALVAFSAGCKKDDAPEPSGDCTADTTGTNDTTDTTDVVGDQVAPVLKLEGSSSMKVLLTDNFDDPGATATDNVDGDITGNIAVSGMVDVDLAGVYVLKYDVSDAAGNAATTVEREVNVIVKRVHYLGDFDVTHDCQLPFAPGDIQSVTKGGQNEIIFNDFLAGIGEQLTGNVDGQEIDIPEQEIDAGGGFLIYTISGDGTLDDTGNIITLNLDYDLGFIGSGSCTLTYTRQ